MQKTDSNNNSILLLRQKITVLDQKKKDIDLEFREIERRLLRMHDTIAQKNIERNTLLEMRDNLGTLEYNKENLDKEIAELDEKLLALRKWYVKINSKFLKVEKKKVTLDYVFGIKLNKFKSLLNDCTSQEPQAT